MTSANAAPKADAPKRQRKRVKCNEREKRRNIELNKAFEQLTNRVPHTTESLPKIKVLRLAKQYITYLNNLLKNGADAPTQEFDKEFELAALAEIRVRNKYTDRLHEAGPEGRPKKIRENREQGYDTSSTPSLSPFATFSPQQLSFSDSGDSSSLSPSNGVPEVPYPVEYDTSKMYYPVYVYDTVTYQMPNIDNQGDNQQITYEALPPLNQFSEMFPKRDSF